VKWWDYQTPAWASDSKYPAPDGWVDRVRCHVSGPTQGGKVKTINWDRDGGFHSEQQTEQGSKQGSSLSSGIDDVNDDDKLNGDENMNGRSPLLKFFEEQTKIIQPSGSVDYKGFIAWEKEINKWEGMGVTEEHIKDAIEKADKLKSNLSWPGSITKYMASDIARDKRSEIPKADPNKRYKCSDGKWRDAYGEVVGTWKE
jgi:hypothetical protein